MKKIFASLVLTIVVTALVKSYAFGTISAYTVPASITVKMYALTSSGNISYNNGVPRACSTPDNRALWGCTAFTNQNPAKPPSATVTPVPYPYSSGSPSVNFENDYIPDVVPQEIEIDPSHSNALTAQAIAARSYSLYKHLTTPTLLDNSIGNQAFVPYRFEFLRVEGGEYSYVPSSSPPDPLTCTNFSATGSTQYQHKVCLALSGNKGYYISEANNDNPIFAEFSSDAYLRSIAGDKSYLKQIEDPISYDPAIPGIITSTNAHQRGMSQHGAGRWARGSSSYRPNAGTPWPITWTSYGQILTHYYAGVDVRNGNSNNSLLTPSKRWIPLKINWGVYNSTPLVACAGNQTFSVWLQNTSTTDWSANEVSFVVLNNEQPFATTNIPVSVATGTGTYTATTTINLAASTYYYFRFDMKVNSSNTLFSAQSPSWPNYVIPSIYAVNCPHKAYLPSLQSATVVNQ